MNYYHNGKILTRWVFQGTWDSSSLGLSIKGFRLEHRGPQEHEGSKAAEFGIWCGLGWVALVLGHFYLGSKTLWRSEGNMPSLANLNAWIASCWERRSLHKLFFFLTVLPLTSYETGNTNFLPFLCLSVLVCKMEAIKIESIPQVL